MNSLTICNMALSMLGIPTITRLDEGTAQSKQCAIFFPELRDRVLHDHFWSFATEGYQLQELNEAPCDSAFSYTCSLPMDYIRAIRLQSRSAYRLNGRKILVNYLPDRLLYIRRVEDASLFPPSFAEALQYLLASEIALSNTRDANLAQYYRQTYEQRLAIARSIDSQENIHVIQNPEKKSSFLTARRGGTYSGAESVPLRFTEGTEGKQ